MTKHSGKALDVQDRSTRSGVPAVQWPWNGRWEAPWTSMWHFHFVKLDDGLPWYQIYNVNSGLCLDVA